ncbi:MAG: DNA sulfur modification protein DndE [Minicystis sp.]
MAIDRIQLSQTAKDQLLKLKRNTGIKHWNVLCRWALCTSLAEASVPPMAKIPADSNVEMTWKVFGGAHHELYLALLKARCRRDGLGVDEETLGVQLRLHLHRGIGYLFADRRIQRIGDLFKRLPLGEAVAATAEAEIEPAGEV